MKRRVQPASSACSAAVALLLATACGDGPEVVASTVAPDAKHDAGGPQLTAQLIEGCQAGYYRGLFWSQPSDGGPAFAVGGDMDFWLVAVPSGAGGEFLRLKTTQLVGRDEASGQVNFTADISSTQPCREGEFNSAIENGFYSNIVPFFGSVTGTYEGSPFPSFAGTWTTYLEGSTVPVAAGKWAASLRDNGAPPPL